MSFQRVMIVVFGEDNADLTTVGYSLYDANDALVAARSTAGVVDRGSGSYKATITFPDQFIGLAEAHGLIDALTAVVLAQASSSAATVTAATDASTVRSGPSQVSSGPRKISVATKALPCTATNAPAPSAGRPSSCTAITTI